MALVKCESCGKEISDKAAVCPHCGAEQNQTESEPQVLICKECGAEIVGTSESCPNCGCPVEIEEQENKSDSQAADNIAALADKVKKIDVKSKKFLVCIVAVALLLIIGIAIVSQNTLSGKDKSAYACVLKASEQFKDPSSVRLESGTYEGGFLFCGLSAKNGFGARGTGYYTVGIIEGIISEEENPEAIFTSKSNLNIEKINKKLSKYFESY